MLQRAFKRQSRRVKNHGLDTRRAHAFMFSGLAPRKCNCLIGKYRGDGSCAELINYRVTHSHDPRVGVEPLLVDWSVKRLESRCSELVAEYKRSINSSASRPTDEVLLLRLVSIICEIIEQFFLIHPYANGNGHSGRALAWHLLCSQGFVPEGMQIDDKQAYSDAIKEYRAGKKKAFIAFMLAATVPALA